MKFNLFHKMRSQDASWLHLGVVWAPKGVQDGTLLGIKLGWKRVSKSDAKKVSSWEVLGDPYPPIVVRSLGAGGNKGETGRRLPPSLLAFALPLSPSAVIFALLCFLKQAVLRPFWQN